MSYQKQFMSALEELESIRVDQHSAPDSLRVRAVEGRLKLKIAAIALNKTHEINLNRMTGDEMAHDAVGDIVSLLRSGEASREVRTMVADYIEHLGAKECRELLGVPRPGNRQTKDPFAIRAAEAFDAAIATGASEEQALVFAYDAYFEQEGRTFAADQKRMVGRSRRKSESTVAESTMDEVIRPLLKRAGCAVSPRRPGPSPTVSGDKRNR